ncbi:hypothetical protein [Deinococcus sedimenti]|uniref:Uncharacterized protein n=1 Tax=Deinococcus sedimenti TaxID=1867090 RepID=A0ABQ2S941_9DEIO|nr:hypothetical protein [Deinococcus sedimenti]GGS09844.1 hypothetical protein GCM10008960_40110 [Deinococcus sedimenti]
MTPPALDLLAALALLTFVSGMGGVTYRAVLLLVQLIPPKRWWVHRGTLLVILAVGYMALLMLDVPSVLANLRGGLESATPQSVTRTLVFAAWLWTLNTILLMLARGQLGARPNIWRKR